MKQKNLYMLTRHGSCHEDHLPELIADLDTIKSKYVFLCDISDIENLEPNKWKTFITCANRDDIDDIDEFIKDSIDENDFSEKWCHALFFANVLRVDVGKDIPFT